MMLADLQRLAVPVLLATALLAQGCSSPPKPMVVPPRSLEISVRADPGLNPDARSRPTPVVVRVYELRVPLSFEAADFFALFDKDQATLGNDMAAREELQLRPGEVVRIPPRELKPDVRAIGVFVAFREIERSRWRAVLALPAPPAPTATPPAKPIPVPVSVSIGARDVKIEQR